jgi:arabinogalactan endo-1,4-beta-galactosidase
MMEATGFPFRDKSGVPQDCLTTLKSYGMNAVRLRTWIKPSSHPHHGHCSAEETLALGLRAQRMGFDVMIDFHYGDSWRDPNFQEKPVAWKNLTFEDLLKAVSGYTSSAMKTFIDGGLRVQWAQIGNETNPGLLMPDGSVERFDQLAQIYNAGHDAVKSVSPETRTMIHLAEGNKTDFLLTISVSLKNSAADTI